MSEAAVEDGAGAGSGEAVKIRKPKAKKQLRQVQDDLQDDSGVQCVIPRV